MAAFICRMCGAPLALPDKARTCKCRACGVLQSVPFLDSEEKSEACKNAERLRREGHYDKALELLNGLIGLSPADADLYWAAALCRYTVTFSGDKLTVKNPPAKSLLSDEDFKTALKFADEAQRKVMEGAAAKIDEVRRKSIANSLKSGDSRDVILCCKSRGVRAKISAKLTAAGYAAAEDLSDLNVFNTVKAMLIIGESAEDFRDSYLREFMASGRAVIPVYRNISPEELPEELQKLQACDMNKLGWENDILSALAVIFGRSAAEDPPSRSTNPMLRRIYIMLDDGDFSGAERIAALLLEKEKGNPMICAEAYLARLLCEYKISSERLLEDLSEDYTKSENYRKAMQLGNEGFRIRLRRLAQK